MLNAIEENIGQVLSVNLGFVNCHKSLQKSLWWITRDHNNKNLRVVLTIENNEIDTLEVLSQYSSRCSWLLIKTDEEQLYSNYNIQSYKQSKNLAYDICNHFCTNKKVVSSPEIIYGDNCFKQYADLIEQNTVLSIKCFLMPEYVQVGLTEASSNMCEHLAKECRKFPIHTEDFLAQKINYQTKGFYGNENDKLIKFSEFECFYLENNLNKDDVEQNAVQFDESKIDSDGITRWLC